MTTLTTKTWFEDGKIMEQNIPETEIYKREWAGGLMTDNFHYDLGYEDGRNSAHEERRERVGLTVDELIDLERKHRSHASLAQAIEAKLKEKNT